MTGFRRVQEVIAAAGILAGLMADTDALERTDRSFVTKLLEDVSVLATAVAALKRLALLLRKRSREALDDVLAAAIATPLAGFVKELRKDIAAVQAAPHCRGPRALPRGRSTALS